MMRPTISILMGLALALAGCKKEEKAATGGAPVTATPKVGQPESGKPIQPAGPKFPWNTDYAPLVAKLQGAWLIKDVGYIGSVQAWNVEGNKVTMYDPKKKTETAAELIFNTPCDVDLKVKTADGEESWGSTLVVSGDTVHLGLGSGGIKTGDEMVVCASMGTYYLKGGECTFWKETWDKWESKKAECSFDDKSFKGKTDEYDDEYRFQAPGVVMTDQLAANKPERQADWATAKAKADGSVAKTQ